MRTKARVKKHKISINLQNHRGCGIKQQRYFLRFRHDAEHVHRRGILP